MAHANVNLVLIGARGAGKSAAGRRAARELAVPFVDADRELERRAKRSIADFFAAGEEAAFRTLEAELHLELLAKQRGIVATGGGCVISAAVRAALARHGAVIWLQADVKALGGRIRGSARPSLWGGDPADELPRLLAERSDWYQACATHTINTSQQSVKECADAIKHLWINLIDHDLR